MNHLIYIVTVFCCIFSGASHDSILRPNLPAGVYQFAFKGILQCHLSSNTKIHFNWYLSKKSANVSEIKGNITSLIPFDDTLNLEINMAVKDSIGGWKDNAFLYKSPKGCTTIKNFLGNMWPKFVNSFGIKSIDCPIRGTYTTQGLDTQAFKESNFPKTFFYGTYKLRYALSRNNETFGCIMLVIDIKRLWETD